MSIPISIEKLMNENIVEYARIEFKENWKPEPILHTICAFANDNDNWDGSYIEDIQDSCDELTKTDPVQTRWPSLCLPN